MTSPQPAAAEVVVAVLTFRRAEQLGVLLPQLVAQAEELDADGSWSTTVVVVDNDPARSGEPVAAAHAPRVRYVHEEVPGIAAGRARAVAEAGDADALVFIDDDEEPTPGWLARLVGTWHAEGRPAGVVGRVSPTYAGVSDPWVDAGGFFRRRRHATGTEVAAASSANLLLDLRLLRALGLTFDRGLGLRGGEDTLLTQSLTRAGHRLIWCDEAEVVDHIPPSRMDRRWVLRRAFSHGAVASRIELGFAARVLPVRARLAVGAVARVAAGLLRALLGRLRGDLGQRARGWRLAAKGAGMLVGALGRDVAEYRRP
ncbi:Glycosyltransferase, GT2 family [Friedmanniella luteola]|uniref:Glycosyltransferase, GT2 family n=1 Tax=Friedmanniella luteola TaxID=546871 RepID=A0A1H1LMF3_9ACTN|nr:glycosyltransferase [Friedmanniella luteola]SDR75701.1 Glycosyltransferase, GT2 family [Friedmanniella luteola]